MASVPVDDDQPRCALSGEKFDKFWHDDHQVVGKQNSKAFLCKRKSTIRILFELPGEIWHSDVHLTNLQEWHYKHAVRINAEDAANHGLTEGVLVLESTLVATPSSSQEGPTGDKQSPTGQAVSPHSCVLCHVPDGKLGVWLKCRP